MSWPWRARTRTRGDGERFPSQGPGTAPTAGPESLLQRLGWWWNVRRWGRADDLRTREVFAVLQMQMRLATVASILRRIESEPQMFARQHHWRTTLWAYDSLLAEACMLAGLEVREVAAGPKADAERSRRELALTECGWHW